MPATRDAVIAKLLQRLVLLRTFLAFDNEARNVDARRIINQWLRVKISDSR